MARPVASPEERERQRRRIRRAAAEIYGEDGLLGVTVRAIAKRAGVSTGTIYVYYASLAELMRSLWGEPVARANRELEAIARSHRDPVRRVEALLEAYADFAFANPEVYRGALMFVRPESLPAPEVEPLSRLTFHHLLRTALHEGQASDLICPGDVDDLAQLLWSGVHGTLALPISVDTYALERAEKLVPLMIRNLMEWIEP